MKNSIFLVSNVIGLLVSLPHRSHRQFNSAEVGEKLALTLLAKLDPTMDQDDLEIAPDADLLPRYSKPKVRSAMLPGILLSSLGVNLTVV